MSLNRWHVTTECGWEAMRTRYLAAVTFESDTAAPETVRMEIVAASHQKAASSAVRAAKQALKGKRPCSIVVVLELDRSVAGTL